MCGWLLKGFKEPVTLYELLLDNDPDFSIKQETIQVYGEAYAQYCSGNWTAARKKFLDIFREYGLTAGVTMALRCDALAGSPSDMNWKGVWSL
jgi:hypothetical protein